MANSKYYKQEKYNNIYSNEPLETPIGRAGWVSLITPKPGRVFEEGKPPSKDKFELTLFIPKDGKNTEQFKNNVQLQVNEMLAIYNENNPAPLADSVILFEDGDKSDPEQYPQKQGCWVLVARSVKPVRVVDGSPEPKDIEKERIAAGVKVKCLVSPKLSSKGVGFTLNIVQLIKDDGVRFTGGVKDFTKMLSACTEEDDAGAGSLQAVVSTTPAATPEPAPNNGTPVAGRSAVSAKMAAAVNKL